MSRCPRGSTATWLSTRSSSTARPVRSSRGACSRAASARPSRTIAPRSRALKTMSTGSAPGVAAYAARISGSRSASPPGLAASTSEGVSRPSPPGPAYGRRHRGERGVALPQQRLARFGQLHRAVVALQQPHPEAAFEPLDRPRQRRLRDAEPLGRPPEVQLLCHRHEIGQLPRLHGVVTGGHTARVSPVTETVLGTGRDGMVGLPP